jgi:hypothetical protein
LRVEGLGFKVQGLDFRAEELPMRVTARAYLEESVPEVDFQKSIPPQIHQLILHYYWYNT